MELLAPAGTLAAFEAALAAGADAVYIGAPGLNARALARDFTFAEIAAMTSSAHVKGKKVYVAMNSLVKEGEIRLALESLSWLAAIGPDALIVQDLGIVSLVRRFFPSLRLHASTLMTVTNASAGAYFKQQGFARIVLARELSLAEIRSIHQNIDVPLEIFVHGAMCFSYSGLCRFSSLHGGKSSLRGQCVQPCRRRYDWLPSGKRPVTGQGGKGGYLFSMNDLSGIDHLAALREAGVVSLKIEGRLKSVEYVRTTVRAYRLALDALDAAPDEQAAILREAYQLLEGSMGRKRCSGFFIPGQEDRLIVPRLSGSTGQVIGKVVGAKEIKGGRFRQEVTLEVILQAPVCLGDRLRLYEERSGERTSFTLRSLERRGNKAEKASAGETVSIRLGEGETKNLRLPIQGVLFRVDVSGRGDQKSQLMRRAGHPPPPPDPAVIGRLLADLGLDGEQTAADRSGEAKRRQVSRGGLPPLEWWLKISSPEALRLRLPFTVARVVVDLNQRMFEQFGGTRLRRELALIWALPPVLTAAELAWVREALRDLRQQGCCRFQLGHIGQIALFRDEALTGTEVELYGDFTCNVLNSAAMEMVAHSGLAGVQFSLETDRSNLAAALHHCARATVGQGKRLRVGMYVHGRPPLFTARLDAPHFQGQRTFASPRGERFYLDRRGEILHAYSHTPFSLLAHADEMGRMGLDYVMVDISHGDPKKNCAEVSALLSGRGVLPPVFSGNYAGNLA